MDKQYDVIIAGAGPIGLFLASELALGGASVLVLEREATSYSPWKGVPLGLRGLNVPSVESLYRRGLLEKIIYQGDRPLLTMNPSESNAFVGHFAGIMITNDKLDLSRWKYRIPGPALRNHPGYISGIETVMAERAESLGATILRAHGVSKIISQDENSITVEAGENELFHGKWLVGCDGGHSVVRRAAEFEFLGAEAKSTGYAVQCDFDHPERLVKGFTLTGAGLYVRGLPGSIHLIDFDGGKFDRKQELTREHLQEVMNRVTERSDVKITKVHLATSFSDRTKQATTYRKGRVLLAGDAAHIHPPFGGQGLNLGLGDAMNLGWKLAATVRQERESRGSAVDLTLLDTYNGERLPAGAAVLEYTRAQISTIEPGPYGQALQKIMRRVIDSVDGANVFADLFWNLSHKYDLGGNAHSHPLIGHSAPDFELLEDGSRLGPRLDKGRGLLLDFKNDSTLKALITGSKYKARVDYLNATAKDQCGVGALLIRPDGFVAWAVEDNERADTDAVSVALERWFAF